MAATGKITDWIAGLPPVLALFIGFAVFTLAEVASFAAARFVEPDVFPRDSIVYYTVGMALTVIFYMGYPVAIAIHVLRKFGPATHVKTVRMAVALSAMLAAHAAGTIIYIWQWPVAPDGPGFEIAEAVMVFGGLGGPLYIMWTAARGLVYAEYRRAVAFNRVVGTFVMFFFLPVTIYFLQRRVCRLEAGPVSSETA